MKPGKAFLFWGLDNEYHSVAVVGIGNQCEEPSDIELINQQKENIRIAASGKNAMIKIFFYIFN